MTKNVVSCQPLIMQIRPKIGTFVGIFPKKRFEKKGSRRRVHKVRGKRASVSFTGVAKKFFEKIALHQKKAKYSKICKKRGFVIGFHRSKRFNGLTMQV